jgi:hypothetical protein
VRESGRLPEFSAEIAEAKTILAKRYVEAYPPDSGTLLTAPRGERAVLLLHSPDRNTVRTIVFRELRDSPDSVIQLLELVLPGVDPDITDQNLRTLNSVLDLQEVDALTRDLQPDALQSEQERVVLREFREWIAKAPVESVKE